MEVNPVKTLIQHASAGAGEDVGGEGSAGHQCSDPTGPTATRETTVTAINQVCDQACSLKQTQAY